jgi:hypothetical protein
VNKPAFTIATLAAIAIASATVGCERSQPPQTGTEQSPTGDPGTLALRANGEDFVRRGFVSKDGWQINFDRVAVHLSDVTAYQTDPPYNAEAGGPIQGQTEITLVEAKTVDLAAGDATAEPILVGEVSAPAGQYNALAWTLAKAPEEPEGGYPLILEGTAQKDGENVEFTLKIEDEITFHCGEFVGDERKGIVQPASNAELEATFHFDHLFGDGELPPEDELNRGAIGFEPLAALAQQGKVETDLAQLKQTSPATYEKIEQILPSLGHVGEGHCHAMPKS